MQATGTTNWCPHGSKRTAPQRKSTQPQPQLVLLILTHPHQEIHSTQVFVSSLTHTTSARSCAIIQGKRCYPHAIYSYFTPSPTSVPAPSSHTTTLQPLFPMRRQPRYLASSCIPTHFLYARMHYELCGLAWKQQVAPNLPSLPHMRTRVLK